MLCMSQLGFIEPQLLTSVDQPPQGDEWLHEIKHDGYRTLLVVKGKQATAYTRTGVDWTNRYRGIVSAALKLDCRSAILDGEVIVQDERELRISMPSCRSSGGTPIS
jgi:bifunctional non-homologous end joining protein LigD